MVVFNVKTSCNTMETFNHINHTYLGVVMNSLYLKISCRPKLTNDVQDYDS